MINRIFKYQLEPDSKQIIMMPKGAQILSLRAQAGIPYLFALVDPAQPHEARVFRNVTTGEEFNAEVLFFIGTLMLGGESAKENWYTLHCFEVETALIPREPDPVHPRFTEDRLNVKAELREGEF